MDKAILVTYASKYGATREIAEKIGEDLRLGGLARGRPTRDRCPRSRCLSSCRAG